MLLRIGTKKKKIILDSETEFYSARMQTKMVVEEGGRALTMGIRNTESSCRSSRGTKRGIRCV